MQICLCFNLFVFLTAKRKESNIYLVLHHRILKIFLLVSAHSNWCTITKVMVCTVLSVGRKYTILNLCYRNIYLRKEMFYLTTHSTHFMYGYMVSAIYLKLPALDFLSQTSSNAENTHSCTFNISIYNR